MRRTARAPAFCSGAGGLWNGGGGTRFARIPESAFGRGTATYGDQFRNEVRAAIAARGNSANLTVSMRVGSVVYAPREGANGTVDLAADQAGIVSLNPAHVVLTCPQSTGNVQVTALASGSTLLRMTVPPKYLATGTPFAVSVAP